MATVVNYRDVKLAATSPRMVTVTLPTDVLIPALKAVLLTGTSTAFRSSADGLTGSPSSITITATNRQITGSISFSVTSGTATLTGTGTTSPATRTLAFADMGSGSVTIRATVTDTDSTVYTADYTIVKVSDGATGGTGPGGQNTAIVYLYQRSTSAPAVPSATVTYTFATNAVTGVNNGWSTSVPAGTNPLYVTAATAAGTGSTDTIATGEWASPVIMAQDGVNSATVFLFQRTTTSTPPTIPSATVTYTFATGAATGVNNGWAQSMPTTGGSYRWMTAATAINTTTTDTILTGEWSTPAILAQDGADGANGQNTAIVNLYQRSTSTPAVPSATVTYTFATNAASGVNNGWTTSVPAGTNPLYFTAATAAGTGATDTILTGEWSSPVVIVDNGINTASVFLYQRTTTNVAPSVPSATVTYTFSTAAASGINNGWSQTMPAVSSGSYAWMTVATAAGTGTTDTILTGEWATPSLIGGQRGSQAVTSAQYDWRISQWDDTYANRLIFNAATGAALKTALATTTHLTIGDMATETNGSPWRYTSGTYDVARQYYQNEIVINAGGTIAYRCIADSLGNAITNTTYFTPYISSLNSRGAWSSGAGTYTANDTVTGNDWAGVSTTWIAMFTHAPIGTFVSERDGGGFAETRYWSGAAWTRPGQILDGSLLVRGSVSAEAVFALTLAALSASLGSVVVDANGYLRGGQTAYNTGIGFFLGWHAASGTYRFSLGDPSGKNITWDGSTLGVTGTLNANGSLADANVGTAAIIANSSGAASVGVVAYTTTNTAIVGFATGSGGSGVSGSVLTGSGVGVSGDTAGNGYGVQGGCSNVSGVGVRAYNSAGGTALAVTAGDATFAAKVKAGGSTNTDASVLGKGTGILHGGRMHHTNGTQVILASGAGGGVSFNYDVYGDGSGLVGPFTGAHDALMPKGATQPEVGDILVDVTCLRHGDVSNTLFEVAVSSAPMQKAKRGIATGPASAWNVSFCPAALRDRVEVEDEDGNTVVEYLVTALAITLEGTHNRLAMNGLGEGQINVCGEGGDLEAGDYICTSSMPGKGMRQNLPDGSRDPRPANYTVAEVRENVTFDPDNPSEVKMVACIYRCA